MNRLKPFLFFLCTLLCVQAYVQDLSGYKKVEGLNSNVVYCVMQDSKGYIWMGTEAGASRYDGYGFKHFTKDDGLSDNDVFQIHEDKKGRLWLLTYNGEPTIYDHGEILTAKNRNFLAVIQGGSMATDFLQTGDTILYVTLKKAYLFVKDKLVTSFEPMWQSNKKGDYVFFIKAVKWNGSVYLVTRNGMMNINGRDHLLFPKEFALSPIATKLLLHKDMLVATSATGVLLYDLKREEFSNLGFNSKAQLSIKQSTRQHKLWVSNNDAVFSIDMQQKKIGDKAAIKLPLVADMIEDKEGSYWVATLKNGLYSSITSNMHEYTSPSILHSKAAYSLGVFNNSIFAGYANNDYIICNTNKLFKEESEISGSAIPSKVYGFYSGKQSLWVAAGNRLEERGKDGKLIRQVYNNCKAIAVNDAGNLYVAHSFNTVKLNVNQIPVHKRINLTAIAKNVFNERVNSIRCSGKDSVWLGAISGIKLLVNDQLVKLPFTKQVVFNTSISKVIQTKFGIAFSTNGEGVVLLARDSFYVFNKNNGLLNNSCNGLYAKGDTIWVATNGGLSRLVLQSTNTAFHFSVKNYTDANGLLSNKVNDVVEHNDTVWVATENGICFFNSSKVDLRFPAPVLIIEQVLVNGTSINFLKPIKLSHTANNVQLKFTGISFYSKKAITYKYKLEGAENDWHQTTFREVEFASLAPGKYVFLLQAANADGIWSTTPQRVEFEIEPPFWQSWLFEITLLLLSALLVYFFIRYRLKQQRKQHNLINKALVLEKEKAEYAKQLIELEQQALRLQMNPHFIFNAITAVQGFYAVGKTMEAKEYLQKFSRMLRNVFEVSALPFITIAKEMELVEDYIQLTISKLNYPIYCNIKCSFNTNDYLIPPLLLQPFVENALIHGLMPLKKEGNLTLTITKNEKHIIFCIEDDGIGMGKTIPYNDKPKGLSVTQKRIELLNDSTSNTPVLQIETLSEKNTSNTKNTGTKITFTTSIFNANNKNHISR